MTKSDRAAGLEGALADLEREADTVVRVLLSAVKEAKRVKAAATTGLLRDAQQAVAHFVWYAGLQSSPPFFQI